jgi:hypothetical protein
MRCPACGSTAIRERPERTAQGYRRFRCRCGKQFNERSAGVLNKAQYPSDIIALVVLWRLRYNEPARPGENLRRKRKGRVGRSWYIDETYIKVRGQWRYLYRAMDRDSALVDVMLSEDRDLAVPRHSTAASKADVDRCWACGTLLPIPRRIAQLPSLPIPDAPTCCCCDAALAAHAEGGDCPPYPGNRLSG